jgi:hypothetical protein
MANPKRGEVSFPSGGKGAFFLFTLSEGEELEAKFGTDFFEKIDLAAHNRGLGTMLHCIRMGLKKRGADGKAVRLLEDDSEELPFHWTEATQPVLDAVSLLVTNETYAELMAKVIEAQKKQLQDAVENAKEAAETAGVPLSEEALASVLSRLQFGQD